jgi:hypothetical protein
MLLDSPPQRCATYSELPLLDQTCAEVRKREARILIETTKEKLKALVVNFRGGSSTIFFRCNAAGLTKSSEEIANKTQAHLKPIGDLALGTLMILIRMDHSNAYVF